jgi:hypothetical protein
MKTLISLSTFLLLLAISFVGVCQTETSAEEENFVLRSSNKKSQIVSIAFDRMLEGFIIEEVAIVSNTTHEQKLGENTEIYAKNNVGVCYKENGKCGFMNNDFQVIFPPKYEDIQFDETGNFCILKLNGKYAFANKDGKILTDFAYNKI